MNQTGPEMHKFIVNNRIRSDSLVIQQAAAAAAESNGGSKGNNKTHLNAVLPPTHTLRDLNNNNMGHISSSSSSASSFSSSIGGGGTVSTTVQDKSPTPSPTNPIRMNGYLKKKRNRVGGGWRKLWFVLQNQLIVSYSSKEAYEKKLAPFKDLINLVPGTIIKPAPGARFTIETTANVVYTFRCDNNKVCSEWITAICECLGIKSRRKSIPSLTSQKWSLNRTNKRFPKLPMAKNTARIFQKGVMNEPIDHIAKVQQDFRLHSADVVQSSAVSRINRMFDVQKHPNKSSINVTRSKASVEREGSKSHTISSSGSALKGRSVVMETVLECDDIEEQMQCITLEDMSLLSTQSQEDSIDGQLIRAQISNLVSGGDFIPNAPDADRIDGEPIYAVIDLNKKKHQRREKLSKQMPFITSSSTTNIIAENPPSPGYSSIHRRPHYGDKTNNNHNHDKSASKIKSPTTGDRPKSFQFSSDYEEVHHFSHMKFSEPNSSADEEEEEENIYEPINIPESVVGDGDSGKGQESQTNLWRYFPKINFDAIMEGMGKRRHPHSVENPSDDINNTSSSSSSSVLFSDIRRKLGSHRRSIKKRMKNVYHRSQSAVELPKPSIQLIANLESTPDIVQITSESPSSSPPPLPIIHLPKCERSLFPSFSRLRKARTQVPKQNQLIRNTEDNVCHRKLYNLDGSHK